jgi:glycosyltransferase involved in cell wall biosynthesis
MNILQIGTTDKKGGAAQVSWQIKKHLDSLGIANSMFVRDKYSDDKNVFRIPNRFPRLSKILKFILSDDISYSNSDWILGTEEYRKADIVHCHNLHGYYFNLETFKKMCNEKKVVWTFHDMWPITSHCSYTFEIEKLKNGFFVCPSRKIHPPILFKNDEKLKQTKTEIYKKSDFHIVTPSEWLLNLTKESVLKDKNMTLIYNGVDKEIFFKKEKNWSRTFFNLPQDKKIALFLSVGGLKNPFKGGKYFKKVAKKMVNGENLIFLSVGGDHKNIFRKDNVIFIPKTQRKEDLATIYSACDFLINPTLADNCPLNVIESLSCGLPIISFKTGGVPELVTDGLNGFISKYKDEDSLLDCCAKMLDLSKEELEKMSNNAIETSNKFDKNRMLEDYVDLYKTFI